MLGNVEEVLIIEPIISQNRPPEVWVKIDFDVK